MNNDGAADSTHSAELASGNRFAFGENWSRFLSVIDDERIMTAEASLKSMLEVADLSGKTFLDVGSGSGLFSLAARRLGARVRSFDYDPASVRCTRQLKKRFFDSDPNWTIEEGSILDQKYLAQLGKFDIVYSWGVLHHTGSMWKAMENISPLVSPHGALFIALYNRQPIASRYWSAVKKLYNRNRLLRPFLIGVHLIYPTAPSLLLRTLFQRRMNRGMSFWHDLLDWLGGYPFEVASPEEVLEFCKMRGYRLTKLKTVGGRLGCNEYVFSQDGFDYSTGFKGAQS